MVSRKNQGEKERFEVLLEDLKSEFRNVTERVIALDEKVDREIHELKSSLEQRMGLVEAAVTELSRDMHQRFENVDKQLEQIRIDIRQLDQRVTAHEQAHA